jgi:hypothetical protein
MEGTKEKKKKKYDSPGRPTKYRPYYCGLLIEKMSEGFSYEAFAGFVSVAVDTLYEWEKNFKEFSDAKKVAFTKNRVFWEKACIDNLINSTTSTRGKDGSTKTESKSLNNAAWIFNMKNRFHWRDRMEVSSDDEKPLKITMNYDPKKLKKDG